MWRTGRTYTFVPSGDADEILIRIVSPASMEEAAAWYERMYDRPFDLDASSAFRALVVRKGWDGDIHHHTGSTYYVFDTDFGPSHSQPRGVVEVG